MIDKAFILAAGLGTRLRPLTDQTCKPALPVLGHPVIEYVLEHLKSAGVREAVINTHHCPEVLPAILGGGDHLGMKLSFSFEPALLETGGGLKNVERFLQSGTFIVYNGDILTDGDLIAAVAAHRRSGRLGTLILIPSGPHASVRLDSGGCIASLRESLRSEDRTPLYTFTGIHILEPEIFVHIPAARRVSIVDTYMDLIRSGKTIGAHIWTDCYWSDIGDPSSYRTASKDILDGRFRSPIPIRRLGQDGSDRIFYRSGRVPRSVIVMRYGHEKEENACYASIAEFLSERGLPVPRVSYDDPDHGIVVVEDLGDLSLCDFVRSNDHGDVIALYRDILREIIKLHLTGGSVRFQSLKLSPAFTQEMYSWESRYFEEHLLGTALGITLQSPLKKRFDRDCRRLARFLSQQPRALIHRDLQSKNIMIRNGRPYFIDFQGMRYGLAHYDLASLLQDPYVDLDEDDRSALYEFYLKLHGRLPSSDARRFRKVYQGAAVQRLMQAAGAYGFLGIKKGKSHFLQYIPQAMKRLKQIVCEAGEFDGIAEVLEMINSKNQIPSSKRIDH